MTASFSLPSALCRNPGESFVIGQNYDCVVVGGGIRKPEPLLEFFEIVINLIRVHAPGAAIAFNSDGSSSLEAAPRVLGSLPSR